MRTRTVVDLLLKLSAGVLNPCLPSIFEQLEKIVSAEYEIWGARFLVIRLDVSMLASGTEALVSQFMKSKEPGVRGFAATCLDKLVRFDKETLSPFVPEMLNMVAWQQPDSRAAAMNLLHMIDPSALADRLASILDVDQLSNQIQCDAAEHFLALDAEVLRGHEQVLVRLMLSKVKPVSGSTFAVKVADNMRSQLRMIPTCAWKVLGKLDRVAALQEAGKEAIQQLFERNYSGGIDLGVRAVALFAAKELDLPWAVQLVVGCLSSQDWNRREQAIIWLLDPICEGMLEPHRPTLIGLRHHHDEFVRDAVRKVLGESAASGALVPEGEQDPDQVTSLMFKDGVWRGKIARSSHEETLDDEWVRKNFAGTLGAAFIRQCEDQHSKFHHVPAGNAETRSMRRAALAGEAAPTHAAAKPRPEAMPVKYHQGKEDLCVSYSVASAFAAGGFHDAAGTPIDETFATCAKELTAKSKKKDTVQEKIDTVQMVVDCVNQRVPGWTSETLPLPFDPQTNVSPYPTLLRLFDTNGSDAHAASTLGREIFNSNQTWSEPLTKEGLDAVCLGDGKFKSVVHAVRFIPGKKMLKAMNKKRAMANVENASPNNSPRKAARSVNRPPLAVPSRVA